MPKTDREDSFYNFFSEYLVLLAPLFDASADDGIEELFEFVCCLVHPAGVESSDEDPMVETTALIDDLGALSLQSLDESPNPERTRIRLALLSYCHLTESDFFYVLLTNLLRIRCNERWTVAPFADLARQRKKKGSSAAGTIPPSPSQKIARLKEYAARAGHSEIAATFDLFYVAEIRNAVFHADYALSDTHFHMVRDHWHSPHGYLTRDVPIPDLLTLIDRAFAFYYAVLNRYELARVNFRGLRHKGFPFDLRLKGLVEFLFDEDVIVGFCVYWPNGQQAQFTRTRSGSHAINIWPSVNGGLNINVGLYANEPGSFSPLVERGKEPAYSRGRDRSLKPYWPGEIGSVPLE